MTQPERTGGKTRLVPISTDDARLIEAAGIGGPKLHEVRTKIIGDLPGDTFYYCEPAELERWRQSHQA